MRRSLLAVLRGRLAAASDAVFWQQCMPLNPAAALVGQLKIISAPAVSISLFGIFCSLPYEDAPRCPGVFTRNARLDRECQPAGHGIPPCTSELQTDPDNTLPSAARLPAAVLARAEIAGTDQRPGS
ncbi:hypothetical protein ACKXF4_08315 [Faecalibacterium prausnitzii]|uniref:hypothetical protein n=1 Tax=Faecalibacterium prausnitzii TaxID=853 RepID=UPI003AAB2885